MKLIKKLKNGLTVMIIPKKGLKKKYVIWGTHYGSNDSKFIVPGEEEITEVPKGVAHFLEHKMFEQKNGKNSLDVLTSLGVSANAYTTNNHTAYLYECTDNFYEALDELMDYVQHPYFTDENVEKEKGIIGQEIMMYDDYPEWKVYLNALEAMYHEHPVKLDITGTIETIKPISKEILYKCYNTFYNPSNMCLVVSGDFEPEELIEEIKKAKVMYNQKDIKIKTIIDCFIIDGQEYNRVKVKSEAYLKGFWMVDNKVISNTEIKDLEYNKEDLSMLIGNSDYSENEHLDFKSMLYRQDSTTEQQKEDKTLCLSSSIISIPGRRNISTVWKKTAGTM